jgi:hypothetical protein
MAAMRVYPTGAKAETLLREYKDNEIHADAQFKGRLARVDGVVGQVSKDPSGETYVTVGTGAELETPVVQCFIAKGEETRAAALSKGKKVMVEGRVDGLMTNVILRECVLGTSAKICARLSAFLGNAECRTQAGSEGIVLLKDGNPWAGGPVDCASTVDGYEAIQKAAIDGVSKSKKSVVAKTFGSREARCQVLLLSKEPLPDALQAKTKAFFDAL